MPKPEDVPVALAVQTKTRTGFAIIGGSSEFREVQKAAKQSGPLVRIGFNHRYTDYKNVFSFEIGFRGDLPQEKSLQTSCPSVPDC